ncbi:hypothetical protein G7068_09475 [Leucobacter viscericola]|uniref:Uncharacterized protein n=1 Tax=Leucobacter viscericola TaxID=2714935 RepID=A0A6G7XFS6_9MICO|nr:hypothetical protein [Leucobacter viscericola]QIK63403.1 hypothetical protein G7068_09475 [Leucobacter viscericola]
MKAGMNVTDIPVTKQYFLEIADQMRAQPIVSYSLSGLGPGVYVEFPLNGEQHHAWVGYWSSSKSPLLGSADVIVATAPAEEIDNLLWRLHLGDRDSWMPVQGAIVLEGSQGDSDMRLWAVDSDTVAATALDDETVIVVVSRGGETLLQERRVTSINDPEPFIAQWASRAIQGLEQQPRK